MTSWADPSGMLSKRELADFVLKREDGTKCLLSELVRSRGGVFLWLGKRKSPRSIFSMKSSGEKKNTKKQI